MADDTVTDEIPSSIPAAIGPYRNRVVGLRVVPAGELLDNPRNWRQHPPAQKAGLDAVMRQVGVIDVVRYNAPTNRLWDGHLRKELFGADPATPVLVLVTDLTEEEEAVALATYDPLAGMARADRDMLAALLGELEDAPVVVEDESLDGLLRRVAGEAGVDWRALADPPTDPGAEVDRAEELRAKWDTARGQLWEIPSLSVPGKAHRLLCGDSTSAEDVTRLMAGERARLFATDPPYLVDYDGTNHPHKWNEPDANKDWSDSYHRRAAARRCARDSAAAERGRHRRRLPHLECGAGGELGGPVAASAGDGDVSIADFITVSSEFLSHRQHQLNWRPGGAFTRVRPSVA